MHHEPLISIVSPAYQCAPYLPDMIRAVQSQTWSNWQLLVAEDCSGDGSAELLLQAAQQDQRILPILLERHVGYAQAFNAALGMAKGEIIARQDADDTCDPQRLFKQATLLLTGNYDIVTCSAQRMFPDGSIKSRQFRGMHPRNYCTLRVPDGPCGASIVASRAVYDKLGGFKPEAEWSADTDWNFRALCLDRPPLRWFYLSEDLYWYRQHPGQMTKRARETVQAAFCHHQALYRTQILARLRREQEEQQGVNSRR